MKTKEITGIMLTLLLTILVLSTPVVYATTYTISLEGYTWNHTTITYFIKEHNAAWYSSSFKVAVEEAIDAWNYAIDSFWSSYSYLWPDYINSYVVDVQFQSVTDKHEADVEISFALYRGTVPPYAVAGVTHFFTEKNTNVLRKAKITIYVGSVEADLTLIQKTTEHELGHVVGLGHTSQTDDIMYPVVSTALYITTLDVYGVSEVFGWYTSIGASFPTTGYEVPPSATLPEGISYTLLVDP